MSLLGEQDDAIEAGEDHSESERACELSARRRRHLLARAQELSRRPRRVLLAALSGNRSWADVGRETGMERSEAKRLLSRVIAWFAAHPKPMARATKHDTRT